MTNEQVIIANLKVLLQRVSLQGSEVPGYVEIANWITAKEQELLASSPTPVTTTEETTDV